jgi:serine/threonine protein kinase
MLQAAKGVEAPDDRLHQILRHQDGAEARLDRLRKETPALYRELARQAEISLISLRSVPRHFLREVYHPPRKESKAQGKLGTIRILKHLRHGSMSSSTSVGMMKDGLPCIVKRYRPLREALNPKLFFAHQERMLQRLRQIDDPRIEEIFDQILLEDRTFIQIKPYLRCVSLWTWLKEHPNRRDRIALLQELGLLLQLLHDHQIAHMDLKPDQLLLFHEADGSWRSPPRMLLIDYDFSMIDGQITLPIGSVPYYAPEQFDPEKRPRSHPQGVLADIYAYCVIIHRILSESFPFADGTTEPSHLDVHKLAHDWDAIEIPHPPLREMILQGLHPDPAQRPTLDAIRAILADPALLEAAAHFPAKRLPVTPTRRKALQERVYRHYHKDTGSYWPLLALLFLLFALFFAIKQCGS